MRPMFFALLLAGMALPPMLAAEDAVTETFIDVPPPPPAPASAQSDADDADEAEGDPETEPEVTIIQRKDATYEEYRMNGRLYMVKVVPSVGLPYFFVDRDGDGLMETRMNDRATQIQVPQWVIFSW